jgi:hypothetical protein
VIAQTFEGNHVVKGDCFILDVLSELEKQLKQPAPLCWRFRGAPEVKGPRLASKVRTEIVPCVVHSARNCGGRFGHALLGRRYRRHVFAFRIHVDVVPFGIV